MTAVLATPEVAQEADRPLRTFDELLGVLSCSGPEALERLIGQSHSLDVVVEECPLDDGRGRLLLRVEEWGLKLDFPMSLVEFWDEIDRLEVAALDAM